jgi:hypothetical protein
MLSLFDDILNQGQCSMIKVLRDNPRLQASDIDRKLQPGSLTSSKKTLPETPDNTAVGIGVCIIILSRKD